VARYEEADEMAGVRIESEKRWGRRHFNTREIREPARSQYGVVCAKCPAVNARRTSEAIMMYRPSVRAAGMRARQPEFRPSHA